MIRIFLIIDIIFLDLFKLFLIMQKQIYINVLVFKNKCFENFNNLFAPFLYVLNKDNFHFFLTIYYYHP